MKVILRNGDSLQYYSKLFSVPLKLIIDSNKVIDQYSCLPGKVIRIPGYEVREIVVSEELNCVRKVAKAYKIHEDAIYLLNCFPQQCFLQLGQRIVVPIKVDKPIINTAKPYTYHKQIQDLKRLSTLYPFLFKRTIGKSVLGRSIKECLIGVGPRKVHINASFHANEWITTNVLMRFINDYALALTHNKKVKGLDAMELYCNNTLSLVPMVNPDGVNLVLKGERAAGRCVHHVKQLNQGKADFKDWKANIRGVDLNNQYPADWEIEAKRKPQQPAPRDFPGYSPLSEPEAIAMACLTISSNFDRVIALHTQGKEFYWGYKGLEPKSAKQLAEQFSRVSGYKSVQMIDSYAGYKDWFIQMWRKPGFTIELGEGVNPLPLEQLDEIYNDTVGILYASLYM
jgi:g-D-glutamyl-meso-diaminopimelate peptidase